jgi:hypothetical protein
MFHRTGWIPGRPTPRALTWRLAGRL